MNAMFRFFVQRHTLARLFTVTMILLGVGALLQLKRDVFPEVDFGEMVVTTRFPGASPTDVELNVTNEIEDAIKGIANVDHFTSYSMEDLSIIRISIDLGAKDKDETRDEIREAVNRVTDLPAAVTEAPLVVEINSRILPVVEVGVAGDVPYDQLRAAARRFKRKLEGVEGVARVEEFWNLDREVRVEADPAALARYQIPLRSLADAIRTRNVRATGGSFESYTSRKGLVTLAQFGEPSEVEEVIVSSSFSGPPVRVKDLAAVIDTFEEPRVIARMNGTPAITFHVLKDSQADIIRTVDGVRELVAAEAEVLPTGARLLLANDSSYYLRNRIGVVLSNGGIGLLLVILVLALFLYARAAFWVAVSIPVILLGVVFLLPVVGAHLDVVGLTAMILVLGIIVDDGIIVSENIVRRRELGDNPEDAAVNGVAGVFKPVVATLMTTFFAFAPMFFMSGVFGEFIVSIPVVITLAVLISVVEVVVALPTHLVPGLAKLAPETHGARAPWFDGIRARFRRLFVTVLRLRYLFLLLSVVLFIGCIGYAARFMDILLFPSSAADVFNVFVETPLGSSREHTSEKLKQLETLIAKLPDRELASFTTKIGTHGERKPGEFEHWGYVRVNLAPFSTRGITADEIVDRLRTQAQDSSALEGFDKVLFAVEAGGPPVGKPVTIRIAGPDDAQRRALADAVVAKLETISGVKDIDRNDDLGKPEVRLALAFDKLPRLGLTVADVADAVRIAFDGDVVTSIRYGDEDVEIRVLLAEQARQDTRALSTLTVPNRDGRLIPLRSVASFHQGPGPSSVYHYDGLRTTTVTSDIDKAVTTPLQVVASVQGVFDLDEDWPGTRFIIGGEAEETAESFESLFVALLIAVIGIFFVLILLFDSVTQPLLVMVAIPFGVIGVIIAFAFHGEPLGFFTMLGLIGLTGVVVNDSLVMVSHINGLRERQPDLPLLQVVADGAADRLRAIVMTSITTVSGLLPLAYGIGGSDPFIAPMALALGWGLVFAMPLTLAVIPCMYVAREDVATLARRVATRVRGWFGKGNE